MFRAKRGQQANIGIILVLIFIALVIIISRIDAKVRQTANAQDKDINTLPLANHMQECLTTITQDALQKLMLTGGTFEKQPPLYTDFKQWNVPTLEDMQQRLAAKIDAQLPSCTDTFVTEYEVSKGMPSTKVAASAATTLVESRFPIMLKSGKKSTTIDTFTTAVDYNLQGIVQFTKTYMDMQAKNPYVLLEPLLTISRQQGLKVGLKQMDSSVQFSLIDPTSVLQPNMFQFLIMYDWSAVDGGFAGIKKIPAAAVSAVSNLTVEGDGIYYAQFGGVLEVSQQQGNRPPVVEPIPTQKLQAGKIWQYRIRASDPDGDALAYAIYPPVNSLRVSDTGYITYGPTQYDNNVTATLRVSDKETFVEIPLHFVVYYSVPLPKVIRSGQTSGVNQGLLGKVY